MNVMDTRATSAMLYLDGVHVSFDGFHAINNLSLTLAPGEMRAIIGPNGAGKTTMMDIITGKTKPDQGTVLFDGIVDWTRLDETRIAELGIGRKFQKPTVFESQTVQDNLLLALNVDHSVRGTLFWRGSKAEAERIAAEAKTKMEDFVARRTKTAESKIAQAEAQAVADVRAAAANAAVTAASTILSQSVKGSVADDLVGKGIAEVRSKLN